MITRQLLPLLALITLFVLGGCDLKPPKLSNKKGTPATVKSLVGEWHYGETGEAGYIFHEDGTFDFWEGAIEDEGAWELKNAKVTCLGGDGNWSESVAMAGKDTILWGNTKLIRAIEKREKINLRSELIGSWYTTQTASGGEFVFYEDGSYAGYSAGEITSGQWQLDGEQLILDGNREDAYKIAMDGESLNWGDVFYERDTDVVLEDEGLKKDLLGHWRNDAVEGGVSFQFFQNGTFTSYYGQRESSGTWALQTDTLILDGFAEYGKTIKIENKSLHWAGDVYRKN